MKEYSWKNRIEVSISCLILLIVWELIAIKINNDIYLPTIGQVLKSLNETIASENFINHITSSIYRCFVSFSFALFIAMISSGLAYMSRIFRNFLKPINMLAQSIPTMILIVLALIWADKDKAPFIIGFAIVFPILYDAILSSLMGIDKNIIEMVDMYNIRLIDKIRYIYLPSIKMILMRLLVSTFSLAFKVIIAGEVYGQPAYGIGTVIQIEKMNFNTPAIFAWIIIIAIISIGLDYIQKMLLKINLRWQRA